MHLFQGFRAAPPADARPDWVHPALIRFADECSATFGHLVLYVGALTLFAIAGAHLWDRLPEAIEQAPAVAASWAAASGTVPDSVTDQAELFDKTSAYAMARHSDGGRNNLIRWATAGERPVAAFRPGTGATGQAETRPVDWLSGSATPGLRGGL
jgi:hypothetical protein